MILVERSNEAVLREFGRLRETRHYLQWLKGNREHLVKLLTQAPAATVQQLQGQVQVLDELIQRIETPS